MSLTSQCCSICFSYLFLQSLPSNILKMLHPTATFIFILSSFLFFHYDSHYLFVNCFPILYIISSSSVLFLKCTALVYKNQFSPALPNALIKLSLDPGVISLSILLLLWSLLMLCPSFPLFFGVHILYILALPEFLFPLKWILKKTTYIIYRLMLFLSTLPALISEGWESGCHEKSASQSPLSCLDILEGSLQKQLRALCWSVIAQGQVCPSLGTKIISLKIIWILFLSMRSYLPSAFSWSKSVSNSWITCCLPYSFISCIFWIHFLPPAASKLLWSFLLWASLGHISHSNMYQLLLNFYKKTIWLDSI